MRAPSERPIQFVCIVSIRLGQSILEKSSNSSAYLVIRKNHCFKNLLETTLSHRSQFPLSTCSFARTVWHPGHQFAAASA